MSSRLTQVDGKHRDGLLYSGKALEGMHPGLLVYFPPSTAVNPQDARDGGCSKAKTGSCGFRRDSADSVEGLFVGANFGVMGEMAIRVGYQWVAGDGDSMLRVMGEMNKQRGCFTGCNYNRQQLAVNGFGSLYTCVRSLREPLPGGNTTSSSSAREGICLSFLSDSAGPLIVIKTPQLHLTVAKETEDALQ